MERIAVVMGKMHSGGKKNLVMEYYRHIDRSAIQFDFICDDDSNAIPIEEIRQLGGRVYRIAPYQNILKNMSDMKKIFQGNHYKIMHSYNGTMNIFAAFIGWKAKIPIRINESISMAHNEDKKTIIKNILKRFSQMFSTHYAANGEACGRWQFGNRLFEQGKVDIFKTIIDTESNKYDPAIREKTRKALKISDNIVIGHIGRLTEQKNTLFIIDVFHEVLKQEERARLLIIGDGNLKDAMLAKLKRLCIEDKVLYLGRREDIQPFYNAMDCFLLPSLYEGLPVVGIEAQTYGLPAFFSSEISKEVGVCSDLAFFLDLQKKAREWADILLTKTKTNMSVRTGRGEIIKKAGFDSRTEAIKLLEYYQSLLSNL